MEFRDVFIAVGSIETRESPEQRDMAIRLEKRQKFGLGNKLQQTNGKRSKPNET